MFFIDFGFNGNEDRSLSWGRSTDEAYIANPDRAGGDDLILRRGSTFYVDLGANGSTDRSFSWVGAPIVFSVANPDGVGGDDLILRRGGYVLHRLRVQRQRGSQFLVGSGHR